MSRLTTKDSTAAVSEFGDLGSGFGMQAEGPAAQAAVPTRVGDPDPVPAAHAPPAGVPQPGDTAAPVSASTATPQQVGEQHALNQSANMNGMDLDALLEDMLFGI